MTGAAEGGGGEHSRPSPPPSSERAVELLVRTRRALHGVAELVLAGPQHRRTGRIDLQVTPGGFATVTEPQLRLDVPVLVVAEAQRLPLADTSFAALAALAGVDVGAPVALYSDGSGVRPEEPIELDLAAARWLVDCLASGAEALRRLAPTEVPILWPEHFDVAVTEEGVGYGVSPGDAEFLEPYAYVSPGATGSDLFWNARFGAARQLRELPDTDAVLAFFVEGRARARAEQGS